MALRGVEILGHHLGAHFTDVDFRFPGGDLLRLVRIAEELFHFRGMEVAEIDFYDAVAGFERWGLVVNDGIHGVCNRRRAMIKAELPSQIL